MQLNPAEISELIKSRIEGLAVSADIRNQGTVVSVTDGICRVHGLSEAMQGEMLEFPPAPDGSPTYGLTLNLERDSVGAVILGEYEHISEGDTVKCTGRILEVPIGPELKGRVVNALGAPIDGKGPVNAKMSAPIEKIAPGVIARKSVSQPMQTGLKAIDSMVPIGRGQRELIIGDRQTGKTAVAIDTIINQKGKDVICVYVAIGQKASTVAQVRQKLEEFGAMAYTIIVNASASDPAASSGSRCNRRLLARGRPVLGQQEGSGRRRPDRVRQRRLGAERGRHGDGEGEEQDSAGERGQADAHAGEERDAQQGLGHGRRPACDRHEPGRQEGEERRGIIQEPGEPAPRHPRCADRPP